jgi:hypothetical protein
MPSMSNLVTVMVLAVATASAAQSVPATVDAAEAEAKAFPRGASPAAASPLFGQPFGGSADRKCISPSRDGPIRNGSLRSGEFIIRTTFAGPWGLRENRDHKILWIPLHNPYEYRDTLVIRAARIGDAADSLREMVPDWAWSPGSKTNSFFPSLVRFPAVGEWLVVATAGNDWGCFVLRVAD